MAASSHTSSAGSPSPEPPASGLDRDAVRAKALACGFDLCGFASADRHPRLARLADWIASGYAGEMHYLADSLDERSDPHRVLPTVRTVVSLAVLYNSPESAAGSVSRYAWGEDYHETIRARLRQLVQWMAETAGKGFEAFSSVDTAPVQERVFAEQAGLGWIGKNTCLISPSLGSWLFLAEVLTNAAIEPDRPATDQCGTCTRCLEACPTGAIVEPYVVDATKCISYLTIETRGEIEEQWRSRLEGRVYGCDICQDVCPWNRRAAISDDASWAPRATLAGAGILDLCSLSDDGWRAILRRSAMRRAGLRRIRRTLAYAAASLPSSEAVMALDALDSNPSAGLPEVRSAILWSRARVQS